MNKEFQVGLTGKNRFDLWMFIFRFQGVKARDRDALRNLDAVCESFALVEIQAKTEALDEGDKFKIGDIEDKTCNVGSVDLKRLIEYLSMMPENIDTGLALRLLRISEMLSDIKDKKPLASVPAETAE